MPETGDRIDPILAFRFEVRIDDLPVGGFSDCTGLTVDTEVFEYAEGGVNDFVHRRPIRTKSPNVVLKRGIVDRSLWDWHDDVVHGRMSFRHAAILVRDPAGERTPLRFELRRAFPVRWVGPELAAMGATVAIETVELAHHGLERTD